MMDRYVLTQLGAVSRRFGTREHVTGAPNFNIHREMKVPTISRSPSGDNRIVIRFLGFIPPWESAHEPAYYPIARAEGVQEMGMFREAFQSSRCLAVADGCYVWDGSQPYLLRLKSRALFGIAAVAAINRHFNPPLESFALLTIYPNELVAQVHHRMQVILRPQDEAAYLDPATPLEDVQRLLAPYNAEAMELYPVTPRLNEATTSSQAFILPLQASEQRSLFDG